MFVTRRDRFSAAPIQTAGGVRPAGAGRTKKSAAGENSSFDQITLSVPADRNAFRQMVGNLAYQVRTHNTTGKIQELRRAVSSGEYQIAPRETAARMLLMEEGE